MSNRYYLITGIKTGLISAAEFEDLNNVYKYLLDSRITQGDYIIIKGERVL